MKLQVVRANPAGNITLYVLDPVKKENRASIASKLMAIESFAAEQVGFACEPDTGFDGRLEMAGGEFCGNASRAYGMLTTQKRGMSGKAHLTLQVSGSDRPVGVDVDLTEGTARAQMPLPRPAGNRTVDGIEGTLVDLGGIVHFVVHAQPDAVLMDKVEPLINAPREQGGFAGVEAYGVIFLHDGRMTPLVKVPAAGTLVWEGSCGSGSLAAAVADSLGTQNGAFARDYVQPAGTVRAELTWENGGVSAAYIGGSVTLDAPVTVEF